MKTIKYLFLLLMVIVVAGSLYLTTLEGEYDVKRSIVIHANPEVIFNDLIDFKNWKAWGPWYEKDSTIQVVYSENTVGVGASYSWTSDIDGDGYMKTLRIDKAKSLNQEIVFKTPFGDMKSNVYWKLEKIDEGTKVTWGMKGELGFFFRTMAKGMEKDIGTMEEKGLELLEKSIQNKLKIFSIENSGIVDYSGGFYLYKTVSSTITALKDTNSKLVTELSDYVTKNGIRTSGRPFTLYHKYDVENGTTMFSVGYPIPERILNLEENNILIGFMQRGKYVKTTLKGSYKNLDKAWQIAYDEMENILDYSLIENGEPFEVYVTSISTTSNPANLITEIYLPVEKIIVD